MVYRMSPHEVFSRTKRRDTLKSCPGVGRFERVSAEQSCERL